MPSAPSNTPVGPPGATAGSSGMALVVAVALGALVMVLVVGLVTLAAGGQRASGRERDRELARANARLALRLALGDLQQAAGPDQRITAEGSILGKGAVHPHVTGVWRSWQPDPAALARGDASKGLASPYDRDGGKRKHFVRWLASDPGRGSPNDPALRQDFARAGTPAAPDSVTVVGPGSVGPHASTSDHVRAGRVTVPGVGHRPSGGLAWAVMDLGTKARIDIGYGNPGEATGLRAAAAGTGSQPGLWHVPSFAAIDPATLGTAAGGGSARWANPATAALALAGMAGHPLPQSSFVHDFTVDSLGLPVDVVRGGPRHDLDLLAQLPSPPSQPPGTGLYASTLGLAGCPSDPPWEQLLGHVRLYRDLVSDNGCPILAARIPAGWEARRGDGFANLDPPPGPHVMPVVAKVQMIFSVLARDLYRYEGDPVPVPEDAVAADPGWAETFRGSSFDYMLHLLYTPVVTLYNPYNVTLECDDLRVEFANVPFALQVFRNGQAQTKAPPGDANDGLVPFNRMFGTTQGTTSAAKANKRFCLALREKDGSGAPAGERLRLAPGEVRVFSPYIDPHRTWAQEAVARDQFYDYWNTSAADNRPAYTADPGATTLDTSRLVAVPGWPGPGVGFDLDWLCPSRYRVIDAEVEGKRPMVRNANIPMRATDRWSFEFAPVPDALTGARFAVAMSLKAPRADDPGARVVASMLEFDFGTANGLQESLLKNDPASGNGRLRYPREGTVGTLDMLDHAAVPIRDYTRPKEIALFSAQAKTTRDGQDADPANGRWASQPWAFTHPVGPVCSQKVPTDHPSHHSHELDFRTLDGVSGDAVQIDPRDRGSFITAHRDGLKFGTHYEIPLAPVQSLPGLNGANLAGSGYLPRFESPIGNSLAHPLLRPDEVQATSASGYAMVDHSFLLNTALFDHCYFSGLADQTGAFLPGRATRDLAEAFFARRERLADQRLIPVLPASVSAAGAAARLADPEAYRKIAVFQAVRGAFNVNSTSVDAWKAVLASLQAGRQPCYSVGPGSDHPTMTDLAAADPRCARFSRFRLPNGSAASPDPDYSCWQAPRDLTEDELDRLSRAVVRQVRLRGPFLSLGEFVNRQLGPQADARTLRGALQAAIDEADLNDEAAAAGILITEAMVADHRYATPAAAAGPSAQGAPGCLTQADLLAVLGNAATVRSDTFRVRAYGESRDAAGAVVARATCEAVVQRIADYLDPADPADLRPDELARLPNRAFGRRFVIVSTRWLDPSEI